MYRQTNNGIEHSQSWVEHPCIVRIWQPLCRQSQAYPIRLTIARIQLSHLANGLHLISSCIVSALLTLSFRDRQLAPELADNIMAPELMPIVAHFHK